MQCFRAASGIFLEDLGLFGDATCLIDTLTDEEGNESELLEDDDHLSMHLLLTLKQLHQRAHQIADSFEITNIKKHALPHMIDKTCFYSSRNLIEFERAEESFRDLLLLL